MPNQPLIEQIASALGTNASLVEKDWHVVRALGVLAALDHAPAAPAFSGGTSLSKGWGLIKRFSEDIDFKVAMPAAASKAEGRRLRSAYRERVLSALTGSDFELVDKPLIGNESQFFSADLAYQSQFTTGPGLRAHIKVEMSFYAPALNPIVRPVSSLIAQAQKQPPEVPAFPCVDPVETAADKLSALAWRVCTRRRASADDDPTIIRHLHDLAALEGHIVAAPGFIDLVQAAATADASRGGGTAPSDPAARFTAMLDLLRADKLWASEYDEFVGLVSFAGSGETIAFADALAALDRLVASVSRALR